MPGTDFAILQGTAARLHGMVARDARTPVTPVFFHPFHVQDGRND
ncbi:hypothetical protein [Marivita sp.]|jgi:phosphoribosylcarboxyaminoimidazole (NCAIR) mutase